MINNRYKIHKTYAAAQLQSCSCQQWSLLLSAKLDKLCKRNMVLTAVRFIDYFIVSAVMALKSVFTDNQSSMIIQ